jgi:DNA-binding XRE family transcriptional regulator
MSLPKYAQVAASVRAQVADGVLLPGEPAPSGASLARVTGYSVLTCRKALQLLVREGVLLPGASRNARLRVPFPSPTPGQQTLASAARALSESLGTQRRLAGLTQPELAAAVGVSVTAVGHAETGRLWQSRRFWELADKQVGADGELLVLHDAFRAASIPANAADEPDETETPPAAGLPAVTLAASSPVTCVSITWADGTVTIVYPPAASVRPADATPGR